MGSRLLLLAADRSMCYVAGSAAGSCAPPPLLWVWNKTCCCCWAMCVTGCSSSCCCCRLWCWLLMMYPTRHKKPALFLLEPAACLLRQSPSLQTENASTAQADNWGKPWPFTCVHAAQAELVTLLTVRFRPASILLHIIA